MSTDEIVPLRDGVSHILENAFLAQTALDLTVIIIGFIAVYSLIRLNKKLGGKLSSAIRLFNIGMFINISAILWSTFWGHVYTVAGMSFDIHHLLMSVGMIFFIISTHKFSGLVAS